MCKIAVIALGALLAVAAPAAYGQEPGAVVSTVTHAAPAPYDFPIGVEQTGPESATTLFSIGRFAVKVWAPVVPPHSMDADRVFATGPAWGSG